MDKLKKLLLEFKKKERKKKSKNYHCFLKYRIDIERLKLQKILGLINIQTVISIQQVAFFFFRVTSPKFDLSSSNFMHNSLLSMFFPDDQRVWANSSGNEASLSLTSADRSGNVRQMFQLMTNQRQCSHSYWHFLALSRNQSTEGEKTSEPTCERRRHRKSAGRNTLLLKYLI